MSFVKIGDTEYRSSLGDLQADIPHVVLKFEYQPKEFRLNSSAIVSLDSVESLETFNNRIILPSFFSVS